MKNMIKKTICALTLAAVCAAGSIAMASTASASGHNVQDVYVSDSDSLVLYEQASYDSPVAFFAADGDGYELHVMEYMNGFGYCYVPFFEVNGWVDLSDTSYVDTTDFSEIYDNDEFVETLHSSVATGYLALRTAPAYDDSNVIAKIYQNGTELLMTGRYDGSYGYCYVPAFDMYGWVNTDYTF